MTKIELQFLSDIDGFEAIQAMKLKTQVYSDHGQNVAECNYKLNKSHDGTYVHTLFIQKKKPVFEGQSLKL